MRTLCLAIIGILFLGAAVATPWPSYKVEQEGIQQPEDFQPQNQV